MRRSGRSGDGQTGCILSPCRRVETRTRLQDTSVLPAPPERREDSGDAAPLAVGKPRTRKSATRVTSEPSFGRERPDRTPGKMDKPLRLPDLEPGRDQKSPLRRCFELRHPLRAGPPVRLRLLVRSLGVEQLLATLDDWRFSGLLSGDPPTSTQPQARANMGKGVYRDIPRTMQAHSGPILTKPFSRQAAWLRTNGLACHPDVTQA